MTLRVVPVTVIDAVGHGPEDARRLVGAPDDEAPVALAGDDRIALERVAQLTRAGRRITTMCPICLVNLRKAAGGEAEVLDISQVLAAAGR